MKRIFVLLIVAGLSASALLEAQDAVWQRIHRKYADSVIVLTSSVNLDQNLGSGFFIAPNGQAVVVVPSLTNHSQLLMCRSDGALVRVRVVRAQASLNLVLVQISSAAGAPCVLGDSSRARSGESVGVLGRDTKGKAVIRPAVIAQVQHTPSGVRLFRLTPAPSDLLPGAAVVNRRGEVIGVTVQLPDDKARDAALPIGYLKQMGGKASTPPSKPSEPPLWQELRPVIRAVRQIPDLIGRSEALAKLSVIALQGGCTAQGQQLWKEAVSTTAKLDHEEERSFALSNIALALMHGGEFQAAFEVAKPIPDPLMRATALSQITRIAAQQQQIDLARRAADQLGDCRERCEALVAIGVALHRTASLAATQEPIAESAAETPEEPSPPSPAHEVLMQAHQTAQQLAGFDQVVALPVVSAGWRFLGETEQAQAAQDAALDAGRALDSITREQAIHEVANRVAEYGFAPSVETLLEQLPAERRDAPRVILIEALARQGQLEAAQAQLAQIRDGWKRARAALNLALQMTSQENLDVLNQLLASVPACVERVQIEVTYANALMQRKQSEVAIQRLQQAESVARRLGDSRYTPEALAIVAAGYLRSGDTEKANALFQEALSSARSLGEPWESTQIAKIWLHKAEAVAARMKQEPPVQ